MRDATEVPRLSRPAIRLGAGSALRVSLALAPLSTLPAAVTCAAAFAMSLQRPENPANGGPLPATLWFPVLILAGLFSLASSPVLLPITVIMGLTYLRRVMFTGWRWRVAWAVVAALGLAIETLFLRGVVIALWFAPASGFSRPDWASAMLSAGFVAVGAAMIGVLTIRARAVTGPSRGMVAAS